MVEVIDIDEETSVEAVDEETSGEAVDEEVSAEAVDEEVSAEVVDSSTDSSVGEEVVEIVDNDEQEEKLTERKLNIEELMRAITLILSVYNTALLGLVLVVLTDGVTLTFPVLFMIAPVLFLVVIACAGFIIYWGVNSIALSNLQEKKENQSNGEG